MNDGNEAVLIDAATLRDRLAGAEPPQVFDVSFDLADVAAGEREHARSRLPGSVYLHLDRDLSAPRDGRNGRHPLPSREAAAATLAARGWQPGRPAVVVDRSGVMAVGRAWWMLRWLGTPSVQVLDGGLAAWTAAGGALETTPPPPVRPSGAVASAEPPAHFATVDMASLRATLGSPRRLLVDARAADRFRGENETLDPVAGHIPGALNRPFRDNLAPDGRFAHAATLAHAWRTLLGATPPHDAVMSCGSGVTACFNLLAMHVAGLPGAALYPGSWSEWCADASNPIAVGA